MRPRWPAPTACTWIALRLAELLSLVVHLVAARWSGHAVELQQLVVCRCRWSSWRVRAPGRPMAATSRAGLHVDRAAAGRAAAAGGAPGCRQVARACGRAGQAGGLQVPMVELACGRQADRWRAPAAVACRWIALQLIELLPLVLRLVAARWSGHAAELASADGLHWIALQVAELLSLVPRRVAARPGTARMLAGAGGLQVPMVELACGRQADRWRAPAAVACVWIALQLAELQQLVVHLVAARWSGHAAALAGADGLRVDRAAPGRSAAAGGAPGCRQVVGPCGRAGRRRRPARGSRCGWPICSSWWCTWLPPGGRAMRPRWPAPTVCTWIAPRLIDLQQLVVCRCRWSSWRVRAPGRPMVATSRACLHVDRAAADRAAAAGGAPVCRQVARPCGRGGRRRRSAGGRAAVAGAAPCGR